MIFFFRVDLSIFLKVREFVFVSYYGMRVKSLTCHRIFMYLYLIISIYYLVTIMYFLYYLSRNQLENSERPLKLILVNCGYLNNIFISIKVSNIILFSENLMEGHLLIQSWRHFWAKNYTKGRHTNVTNSSYMSEVLFNNLFVDLVCTV